MSNCPAISLVGETSVSASLRAMDCQIGEAVEIGYNRLFGPGGAFGYALTSLLIIYVALLAYGFLTGRTRLTMSMMSPRLVTMVLVLTFVSVWPAYRAIFYGLLMDGPDQIAAALLGQQGSSAVMNFAERLDALFVLFADIAQKLEPTPAGQTAAIAPPKSMAVTLFWLSGLFLLVSTLGVLILSRLVLNLLLILGPIFILFALFGQTRGLFNGWLRTSLVFALVPMLTVLGGTAALSLFLPLIDAIAFDPQRAVTQIQPMVMLFMGSLIYSAFLAVLMWVAASLVGDWQAALRDRASDRQSERDQLLLPYMGGQGVSGGAGGDYASEGRRTDPIIAAVAASEAASSSVRVDINTSRGGGGDQSMIAPTAQGSNRNRVQGLGQRFRPASSLKPSTQKS